MQITELAARIESLGLNDKEARVYVAALFLGPSSVQKIAGQAEINRATAYVILDQLAELGLMSQSQEGKKTVFVAEPPEALERLFDRQNEIIEVRRRELKSLMPDLRRSDRSTDAAGVPAVRFYKGIEGVKSINAEIRRKAKVGSVSYGFVNYDSVERIYPDVFKSSPQARLKKKISSKVLYSYSKGSVPSDSKLLRQTKKLSIPIAADITLSEDVASFATYGAKNTVGVAIESKEIVQALRQLFEQAWLNQK